MKKYLLLLLTITLMLSGCSNSSSLPVSSNKGLTVHFKKPDSWPSDVYLYYYKDSDTSVSLWPGVPMIYEKNDWYVYTIRESWYKESKIMFFGDDEHRFPQHLEPGFDAWEISNKSGEIWFSNKNWYNKYPE